MFASPEPAFNVDESLSRGGAGRKIVRLGKGKAFFAQGDAADFVLYLKAGRIKITVISSSGKEATIRLVVGGDFLGERAMAPEPSVRITNAIALTPCTAIRISRPEFLRLMRENREFSQQFSSFLLGCTMKTQADLVDQLFNRAEKRLARLLLLLAKYGEKEVEKAVIPPISQETLASGPFSHCAADFDRCNYASHGLSLCTYTRPGRQDGSVCARDSDSLRHA